MKQSQWITWRLIATFITCIIITITMCGPIHAESCKIDRIIDGDTATCGDLRIRLSDIDAPEKKQAYGQDSKEALEMLILGQEVTYSNPKMDMYGRVVARLYVNGVDVSLSQVKFGNAWAYYTKDKRIINAQQFAKKNKLGLWLDSKPIEPSKYRKGIR